MAQTGDDPNKIVDERGMRQVSDTGALQPIVDEVLANCADQGQPQALQRVAESVALVASEPGSPGGALRF